MTEQKMAGAIADAVLNTPEPDKWIDCGESRPLPMFHMHTLMQYGERCAEAALAWLRSQGEPAAWIGQFDGLLYREQADVGDTPLYRTPQPTVPAGWKLVPVEPTPEMCAEGMKGEGCTINDGKLFARDLYSVMLAAAPDPTK